MVNENRNTNKLSIAGVRGGVPIYVDENGNEVQRPMRGLGDLAERIVKPIARLLNMDCIDKEKANQLKPESPCAKRRNKMNEKVPFNPTVKP